uniref:Uncharacterized protein n=1 Tax=Phaeomonas parva TaxID=124430 RepID=A0A7S1U6F4_9STRA|mmetsp:Transcript_33837/g.106893  ORF Transcript_33837/g.106893 Transcript_33837/m.106893 type:complete len:898 (+) Transcript_33837:177-2870(+)
MQTIDHFPSADAFAASGAMEGPMEGSFPRPPEGVLVQQQRDLIEQLMAENTRLLNFIENQGSNNRAPSRRIPRLDVTVVKEAPPVALGSTVVHSRYEGPEEQQGVASDTSKVPSLPPRSVTAKGQLQSDGGSAPKSGTRPPGRREQTAPLVLPKLRESPLMRSASFAKKSYKRKRARQGTPESARRDTEQLDAVADEQVEEMEAPDVMLLGVPAYDLLVQLGDTKVSHNLEERLMHAQPRTETHLEPTTERWLKRSQELLSDKDVVKARRDATKGRRRTRKKKGAGKAAEDILGDGALADEGQLGGDDEQAVVDDTADATQELTVTPERKAKSKKRRKRGSTKKQSRSASGARERGGTAPPGTAPGVGIVGEAPVDIAEKLLPLEKLTIDPALDVAAEFLGDATGEAEAPVEGGGLPSQLDENEWENELARNILALYTTQLKDQMAKEEEQAAVEGAPAPGPASANGRASGRSTPACPAASGRSTPARPAGTAPQKAQKHLHAVSEAAEVARGEATGSGGAQEAAAPRSGKRRTKKKGDKAKGGKAASKVVAEMDAEEAKHLKRVPRGKAEKPGVIVVPRQSQPIWFKGTGAIAPEWSSLPDGDDAARHLQRLEEERQYAAYIATVEAFLNGYQRSGALEQEVLQADHSLVSSLTTSFDAVDDGEQNELFRRLWRQMVVSAIAFGVRACEGADRNFVLALEMLKKAEELAGNSLALSRRDMSELRAFVADAYAYYYSQRGKNHAALEYAEKAMRTHAHMKDWTHTASCQLHIGAVLSRLNRHDEAIRCLGQILTLVEDRKLDIGGLAPQKLCLVAVTYHNIAVEQLALRHVSEACISSQNARRLARLCLSYSNRFISQFDRTHRAALADLATLRTVQKSPTTKQARIFKMLSSQLYD